MTTKIRSWKECMTTYYISLSFVLSRTVMWLTVAEHIGANCNHESLTLTIILESQGSSMPHHMKGGEYG